MQFCKTYNFIANVLNRRHMLVNRRCLVNTQIHASLLTRLHTRVDIIILFLQVLDAIFLSLTITKQVSYPHRF